MHLTGCVERRFLPQPRQALAFGQPRSTPCELADRVGVAPVADPVIFRASSYTASTLCNRQLPRFAARAVAHPGETAGRGSLLTKQLLRVSFAADS